jgi:hypothetical protein
VGTETIGIGDRLGVGEAKDFLRFYSHSYGQVVHRAGGGGRRLEAGGRRLQAGGWRLEL